MASLGTATMVTRLDLGGLKTGFRAAEKEADKSAKTIGQRFTAMGPQFTSIGRKMTLGITAPLTAITAGVVKLSGDFEKSMNRVSALSGATGQELEKLAGQARQLGADTQFSASEAADAMSFLAMAGFDVNQIYSSMPGTLNLAAAAQLDMGSAADIVSNIMTGFGLEASELEGAVDILSKAFISSNTDLRQLGDGMKFVGPIASGLNVPLSSTTAALGALSNAGIQGGMAGTTLRMILGTLASEADKLGIATTNAAGDLLPLADIIDALNEKGMSTTEVLDVFGQRGGPGMAALLAQGGTSLRAFTAELDDAGGTAQRVAETQMQGLHGMVKELQSAAEELLLSLGDAGVLGMAKSVVTGLTTLIRKVNELPAPMKTAAIAVGGVAAAAGPLLVTLGGIARALPGIRTGFLLLRTSILPFLGPVGLIIGLTTVLATLGERFVNSNKSLDTHKGWIDETADAYARYRGEINVATEAERQGAIDRLTITRREMQERFRLLSELAESQRTSVQRFIDSPIGKFLLPGFLNVQGGASQTTLNELDRVASIINQIGTDIMALQGGATTLIEPVARVTVEPGSQPAGTYGDEYDAFGIPTDGSTRGVTVEVETVDKGGRPLGNALQRAMLDAEVLGPGAGMAGTMTPEQLQAVLARQQELNDERLAEAEAIRLANAELATSSLMFRAWAKDAGRVSLLREGVRETLSGVAEGVETLTTDLQAARDLVIDRRYGDSANELERFNRNTGFLTANLKAANDAAARNALFQDALGRYGGGDTGLAGTSAAARGAGIDSVVEYLTQNVRDAVQAYQEGAGSIEAVEYAVNALTNITPMSVLAINDLTDGVLALERAAAVTEQRMAAIRAFDESPGSVDSSMFPRFLTPEQRAFNERMSARAHRPRETGEADKAFIKASKDAGDNITGAAVSFGDVVLAAGQSFGSLVTSIFEGDTKGAIKGGFDLFGDIGAAILPGFAPFIKLGTGLMGDLFSNLFGGGSRDADARRQREQQAARSVPAININFSVQQTNTYQGAPSDPRNEQAFARQADALFESIYRRHLGPRLDRIENRLGIAGA